MGVVLVIIYLFVLEKRFLKGQIWINAINQIIEC